jgi:hypothetical protein
MKIDIRDKIDFGTTFRKNNKTYVVIGRWFEVGGCSMAVEYVRANDDYGYLPMFRFTHIIYDEDIEKLDIIKF